ncbi:Folylpolyglutamate synthase [bioreactor metagenome]|uniref:Folylpolyglutamate synthase n=1 Tax=bioreactor metagenome TaxID=1076179 RepID=A0A645HJK1_9ZZZZ
MISKETLISATEKIKTVIDQLNADGVVITEFEMITAIAFQYFYENHCDIVMLEVGLGGTYDATNIIKTSIVNVITAIAKDHMAVLGNTLQEIAENKCGIIKPYSDTVLYPLQDESVTSVAQKNVKKNNGTLIMPSMDKLKNIQVNRRFSTFEYDGVKLKVNLIGEHQVYNAVTAFETARLLKDKGFHIIDEDIVRGIQRAKIPSRVN